MNSDWGPFLKRTVRFPWRLFANPRLLFYFTFVICFVGALGAWIPFIQIVSGKMPLLTWLSVHRSLATYVIGIVVTSFADCIVRRRDEPTFMLFLFGAALTSTALAITVLILDNRWVTKFSLGATVIAAIVWLMVHDADQELTPGNSYSTLGGEQVQ